MSREEKIARAWKLFEQIGVPQSELAEKRERLYALLRDVESEEWGKEEFDRLSESLLTELREILSVLGRLGEE